MGAVLPSGNRFRHVVFTAPAPRPPLNLGLTGTTRRAARTYAAFATDTRASDCEEEHFVAWLFAEAGLGARHYRPNALRRRLPACLRALRAESLAQARRMLRRHPSLVPVALDALLLGVTEFFRDPAVYQSLRDELASLLAPRGALRVWSAGCSDGAEMYSVAILLAELDALDHCELLGTDCRPDAVTRAAAGAFDPPALRGISPQRLARFFDDPRDADGRRHVAAALRGRITWRQADVLGDPQPGPWHLVLCRNLAMYLDAPAADALWRRLTSVLAPGGLLVVGKAERPTGVPGGVAPVGPCVYKRYGGDP